MTYPPQSGGFNPQGDPGEGHVGLRIMRERAGRIGARVHWASTPGQGTRVVLVVDARATPGGGDALPGRGRLTAPTP